MSSRFQELDWHETPIGAVSLRRRVEPSLGVDVYEVKRDDEFLMSSLFTVGEVELARLGLAELAGADLDVVVGGLGLGYTAHAVLADPRVRALTVVEAFGEVIGWHRRDLLPGAADLVSDPRSRLVEGDFFALVGAGAAFRPDEPHRPVHAVLVDIDHSPRHLLDPSHAPFYTSEGLARVIERLHPGGVFALWSNDPPDADFSATLGRVFATTAAHVVSFPNHYSGGESTNTIYVATRAPG